MSPVLRTTRGYQIIKIENLQETTTKSFEDAKNDVADKNPKLVADLVENLERWRKLHPANGVREEYGLPKGYQAPKQWVEAARD